MNALVPQFSLSIEQITEAFAKQVVSTAKVNITAVIRENLPMWETKLFPVIGVYEISLYEVLADILIEAGCRAAPESPAERAVFVRSVGNKVRAIRSERGELTATQKRKAARESITPDKLRPRSSAYPDRAITTAVDMSQGAVVPPSGVVPGQSPVGGSKAVAVVSAPAGAKFSFKDALDRLRNEGAEAPWSAADDELHQAFLAMCKERGARNIADLQHHIKETEFTKNGAYTEYLTKVRRTGKVF